MKDQANFVRFVILLSKVLQKEANEQVIARHIDYMRGLDKGGKLILCGPFLDHDSGMVIVKVENRSEAVAIAQADPFVLEGVRTFEVRTWLLACAENNYLA